MSYKVSAKPRDKRDKIVLNAEGDAAVLQNLAIILSTLQGEVPLYRDFGINRRSLDKPLPVARTMLVIDITEAVQKFEPRASIINITFQADADNPGRLTPILEVDIANE